MSPKQGRPFEKNGKKGRLEIRTSEVEESMLDFCVDQTGKSRAEIIRQGIIEIYNHCMENEENDYDDYDDEFDEVPEIKVTITCPYCDANNRISISEYEEGCYPYDRGEVAMGEELEHVLESDDFQCVSCGKTFTFNGTVWEYPIGTVNLKNIDCYPLDDDDDCDDDDDDDDNDD